MAVYVIKLDVIYSCVIFATMILLIFYLLSTGIQMILPFQHSASLYMQKVYPVNYNKG